MAEAPAGGNRNWRDAVFTRKEVLKLQHVSRPPAPAKHRHYLRMQGPGSPMNGLAEDAPASGSWGFQPQAVTGGILPPEISPAIRCRPGKSGMSWNCEEFSGESFKTAPRPPAPALPPPPDPLRLSTRRSLPPVPSAARQKFDRFRGSENLAQWLARRFLERGL